MAKIGRPKIEFNLTQVEALGKIQCTLEEVAAVLGVNTETIERRMKDDEAFGAAYKKGRDEGKASLRRKQWELALAGNIVMNIWLGKQYLGQADKQESNINVAISSWDDLEKEVASEKQGQKKNGA